MSKLPAHCFPLNSVSMDGVCQYCARKLVDSIARKDEALRMAVEALDRRAICLCKVQAHWDSGKKAELCERCVALAACREAMKGSNHEHHR